MTGSRSSWARPRPSISTRGCRRMTSIAWCDDPMIRSYWQRSDAPLVPTANASGARESRARADSCALGARRSSVAIDRRCEHSRVYFAGGSLCCASFTNEPASRFMSSGSWRGSGNVCQPPPRGERCVGVGASAPPSSSCACARLEAGLARRRMPAAPVTHDPGQAGTREPRNSKLIRDDWRARSREPRFAPRFPAAFHRPNRPDCQ